MPYLDALLFLALAAPVFAQSSGPPAAPEPPPPPLTVYLTEEEPAASEPGSKVGQMPEPTLAQAIDQTMRARKAAASTTVLTGVVSAVFLAVGLVAMRHRSRVCPRCSARLVQLGDPADAAADADETAGSSAAAPGRERGGLWACPACGELGRLGLAGFLFRRNDRCPRCGKAMRSGYTAVEPATYLMYGLVRVDEACAACDYRASYPRSMPPNEAPPPDWPGSSMRP